MIEYVYSNNIDIRIIEKAVNILENDGIIAVPTDTSWSIVCSIKSKKGIEKLKNFKGNQKDYSFTMITDSISRLSYICDISNRNFKLLKSHTPGPFVFILPVINSKPLNMKRNELGVRIPDENILISLINKLASPLFSITASKQMQKSGWWDTLFAEENLFECGWELEEIEGIDMIIDNGIAHTKELSTVLDLQNDEIQIIREGKGEF